MRDSTPFAIHWFRRDLRVAGNPALQYAWKKYQGRVLGIFCFDSKFLARPDFSANRFAFFLASLKALREELEASGGELLVIDELPQFFFPRLIQSLEKNSQRENLGEVVFNRDYEPFARQRDGDMLKILQNLGVRTHTERDHLLIEPHELAKDAPGSFYQVYSPFSRRWFQTFAGEEFRSRTEKKRVGLAYLEKAAAKKFTADLFRIRWNSVLAKSDSFPDAFQEFEEKNRKHVTIPIPAAGQAGALKRLKFFSPHLGAYKDARDIPNVDGTSQLSPYIKNGSISTAQILAALELEDCDAKGKDSRTRFFKEIIWREFYYHILYHVPRVESGAFLERYKNIQWGNREDWFRAWCEGNTGFPIVDAGMRELNTTGWMHNRVRMIVASFLTKDLLIDWRWGENYFMKMLLDGDLAPNNGGWQWAASTGCDPQPYFRIFNPWLQSAKFDPDGKYIKKYVPELRDIPAAQLHDPEGVGLFAKYPKPIVEHAAQKPLALALYKADLA